MAPRAKKPKPAPAAKASPVVHLRLPEEAIRELDKLAERKYTSRNALIQISISEFIERHKLD